MRTLAAQCFLSGRISQSLHLGPARHSHTTGSVHRAHAVRRPFRGRIQNRSSLTVSVPHSESVLPHRGLRTGASPLSPQHLLCSSTNKRSIVSCQKIGKGALATTEAGGAFPSSGAEAPPLPEARGSQALPRFFCEDLPPIQVCLPTGVPLVYNLACSLKLVCAWHAPCCAHGVPIYAYASARIVTVCSFHYICSCSIV